ncbi:hypothetical protein [Herbidospora sp. RD11066]
MALIVSIGVPILLTLTVLAFYRRWAPGLRPAHIIGTGAVVTAASVALTSALTPPPGGKLRDHTCIYEVTRLGATPFMISPDGHVDQEFTATTPYIWAMRTAVGWKGNQVPDRLTLAILSGDTIIQRATVVPVRDGGTEARFTPVEVTPGARYRLRVGNTTGIPIGVYLAPVSAATVRNPATIGPVALSGLDQAPDTTRLDLALSSCVGGAIRG